MEYEWHEPKRARNLATHHVDFTAVHDFDWEAAQVRADLRFDYGEPRFIAVGPIGRRLHVLVFTPRAGAIRVISLWKANSKEARRYAQTQD